MAAAGRVRRWVDRQPQLVPRCRMALTGAKSTGHGSKRGCMDNAAVDSDTWILSGVVAVLERYNPARHPIIPATDLAADLNVDSVAAMDLIMEIEDRFEIDIPINLVSDMTTVADLVALVERQLKTRDRAQ